MATYVIGDIHGMYTRFLEMLNKINFGASDLLISVGDVIDRGPNGITVLNKFMNTPNMEMILGNHELMMMDYLLAQHPKQAEHDKALWFHNGGKPTFDELMKLSADEQEEIAIFLLGLPVSMEIEVANHKYHIVHGFPADDAYDAVWSRPGLNSVSQVDPDVQVIIGHTPTFYLHGDTDERIMQYLNELSYERRHVEVERCKGFIDIDCGSGYQQVIPQTRLACLRLDDRSVWYV